MEGTPLDQDSTRVDVENALIDLEKHLDESSFLQVPEEQERAMSTPPVMQTPQNEEKNTIRNREGAPISGMDISNL